MIRTLIADDHAVVRQGLRQILEETGDIVVAGEAATGQEVLHHVRKQEWDLVVLDLNMPGASGIDVLKTLRQERPKLPILVLSMHAEDQYALRVIRAGASGYLTKESAPNDLIQAARKVVAGGRYVSPALAELLVAEVAEGNGGPLHKALSDREFQVLRLLGQGMAVSEIAEALSLSPKTVSTYRRRLLDKMSMKSNAELIHYAVKNGLVE